jgi:hypothetical protein
MVLARKMILAAVAILAYPALAAADPAQVLEEFGFFGRWSQHCDRAPAPDNILRIASAASGAARFREQIGREYGGNAYEVLDAQRIGSDRISMRIRLNGELTEHLVMMLDGDRIRTMLNEVLDGDDAGRILVENGEVKSNGASTPWLARCKS